MPPRQVLGRDSTVFPVLYVRRSRSSGLPVTSPAWPAITHPRVRFVGKRQRRIKVVPRLISPLALAPLGALALALTLRGGRPRSGRVDAAAQGQSRTRGHHRKPGGASRAWLEKRAACHVGVLMCDAQRSTCGGPPWLQWLKRELARSVIQNTSFTVPGI